MARKSKYTPETVAKVVQAIKLGATYELAAGYAGITFQTFNEWRKAKPEFSEALNHAEGTGAILWLAKIEQAATEGNWQAAAWKLERRYPHMYGRNLHEMTGANGGPIQHEHTVIDAERLDARLAGIFARVGTDPDTDGADMPDAG